MIYSRTVFVDGEVGSELYSRSYDVAFLPQVLVDLIGGAEASVGFLSSLQ